MRFSGQLAGVDFGTTQSGNDRHPAVLHETPGHGLVPEIADGVGWRTDEGDGLRRATGRKRRVFRQKAVAGMNGFRAGFPSRRNDAVLVEITGRRVGGTHGNGPVGRQHMRGRDICLGIDGHGLDTHFPAGGHDPAGNFATVGNQDTFKHEVSFPVSMNGW